MLDWTWSWANVWRCTSPVSDGLSDRLLTTNVRSGVGVDVAQGVPVILVHFERVDAPVGLLESSRVILNE